MTREQQPLGNSGIMVTAIGLGCWPISGMSSVDVNRADSLKTLRAAIDAEINFVDTAYCYGPNGESERLIAEALGNRRESIVIATKAGIHWDKAGARHFDASPQRIRHECAESLRRLNTDHVDLLYLHAPDPSTPIAESAAAFKSLLQEGKTRSVGVSNLGVDQIQEFHSVCPVDAVQPFYNLLQRDIETDLVPWCLERKIAIVTYWPLLKGLLAGKLSRDHVFADGDGRAKYPMFQGQEWDKNQDFVDELRLIASDYGKTVAQLAVAWTIQRPGITAALCGAKRAYQIEETAEALDWALDESTLQRIQEALRRRGPIVSKPPV